MDLQYITAYHATYIAIALLAFLLCIVPLFEKIPKLGDCVSRRYVLCVVFVVMAFACILNFNSLDTSIKSTVIIGALVVSTLYVVIRSCEKWLYAGFFAKAGKVEVDVDDKKLTIENAEVGKKDAQKSNDQKSDDLDGLAKREHNA